MPYLGKSPTGSAVRSRYYYTATASQTSVSGADDNGKALSFTDGEYVDVYLNGILLQAGVDYGTGTANTISSLAPMSAGQLVEIVVYDVYNVAEINRRALRTRFVKTASGSETSISGTVDNGATITFSANDQIEVNLNGVALIQDSDFNTNTANTVGGLSALSASDVVEIIKYERFILADTVSKADGGTFGGNVATTGDFTSTGKEYFLVDLVGNQTSIADSTQATVDFGGIGTVRHDTKSNFDTSNDAYLLGSDNGVYLISFGCGISSDAIATEELEDAGAQIEVATDGSTFAGLFGGSQRTLQSDNSMRGSIHFSGTYIYKATTATTKIRLVVIADTNGGATYEVRGPVNSNMQSLQFSSITGNNTYFNVVRIA